MNSQPPTARSGYNLEIGDRVLFFIIVAIIALVFLGFGVGATAILTSAACAAMGYEWFRMATGQRDFDEPIAGVALAAAALPAFTTFAVGLAGGLSVAALAVAFFLMLSPKKTDGISSTAAGLLLVGVAGACFVSLRDTPEHGLALSAWVIFVVVATELGSGFIRDYVARADAYDADADNSVIEVCFSLVCGAVAGVVVGAFYRDGNIFWIALASIALATAVLFAAVVTNYVRERIGGGPSGSLFLGRGAVIDNFDGLIFASIAAAFMTAVGGALFNW